ncbi:MAG: Wzz/FepE/Etk N-terminal domain-containing protein [bacterium]|nr:Wzz/FepE/Etk N-terminal domain-containing protein [bacterium]
MGEEPKGDNFLIRFLALVWARKWIIIFCGLFTGIVTLVLCFFFTPIYSSEMTILLPEKTQTMTSLLSAFGGMSIGGLVPTPVDLEAELLASRSVLEEVVVEYGLLPDYSEVPTNDDKTPYLSDFKANETAGGNDYTFEFTSDEGDYIIYTGKGRYIGSGANFDRFEAEGLSFVMACHSPEKGETFTVAINTPEEAAVNLSDMIDVTPSTGDTIVVTAESYTPVMSQNVVTAIVNKYIERTETYYSGTTGQLRSFLENQVNEVRAKLESDSRSLAAYSVEQMVYAPEVEVSTLIGQISALEQQRLLVKVQRQVAERLLESAQTSGTTISAESAAAAALGVPGTTATYDVATSQLETSLRTAEVELRDKRLRNMNKQLEELRTTELSLQREIDDIKGFLRDQPPKFVEYAQLKLEIAGYGELYKYLVAQYEQARLEEQRTLANRDVPRIVSAASYDSRPVRPRKVIYTLIGGLIGGLIGIGIVLGRNYLQRTAFMDRLKAEAAERTPRRRKRGRRGRGEDA